MQREEKGRLRRKLVEQAIDLAMQAQWSQAIEVNQRLIDEVGADPEAWNRLGKAYAQLARIADARTAYESALKLDPTNTIAQRNLQRLAAIKEESAPAVAGDARHADPAFFIEETGKTVATAIFSDAPKATLALIAAGDMLDMRHDGDVIVVTTQGGDRLGPLDGKLSTRLIDLQQGGNQYAIAAISVNAAKRELRALIREMRQSPQLAGRVSFPPETSSNFRAYIKGSVIRDERGDDDDDDTGDDSDALLAEDEDATSDTLEFGEDMAET